MKKSDLLFALLRKSNNVLKEDVKSDTDRKFLIQLKYQYSKLQPSLRNMIRVMATEIDRFSTSYANTNAFTATIENESEKYGADVTKYGHPTLIDNNTGNRFVVYHKNVMSEDVVIFEGQEHHAFIVAFGCLIRAQEHQKRLMKEREIEEQRMNILSGYR